jgi:BMFP domain-containing protein YqiC
VIKSNIFKKLTEQLHDAIPAHFDALKSDFKKICPTILSNTFAQFDLITREEFDVQSKVLARTRKKLDELEKRLAELEKIMNESK